jgi:hypothetical protein
MGVASEITEDLFRPGKWRFGEDHPVNAGQFIEPSGERGVISQVCECAGQAKLTRDECGAQSADERVAKATGDHAPGRQAIQSSIMRRRRGVRSAIGGSPVSGVAHPETLADRTSLSAHAEPHNAG